jgi:eukaryotic-like serine/threonine-protein kinase
MTPGRRGPATRLEGVTLEGGWVVGRRIERPESATGATFSIGYPVERANGQKGFLKALDYTSALREPDTARALQSMTSAYLFERDLLRRCADRRLDRVVYAVDEGSHQVDDSEVGKVDYLIFERADSDLRLQMSRLASFDLAWALRMLHCVATGLAQLHSLEIAHQDVKPSNILFFERSLAKLADLGRAAAPGLSPPHDDKPVAGDPVHAPLELLYRHVPIDWRCRRFGCDLYHLGSVATFIFLEVSMTAAVLVRMPPGYHWRDWRGSFHEVSPYIRHATDEVIIHLRQIMPPPLKAELPSAISELCNPDPELRGHPSDRLGHRDRFSVERYVSLFDLLARRVEKNLWSRESK